MFAAEVRRAALPATHLMPFCTGPWTLDFGPGRRLSLSRILRNAKASKPSPRKNIAQPKAERAKTIGQGRQLIDNYYDSAARMF